MIYSNEQLQKYLHRIDYAIGEGRYTLAVALANRCLRESYGSFISKKLPGLPSDESTAGIRRRCVIIVRWMRMYFHRQRIPYPEQRLLLMTVATNVMVLSLLHNMEQGDDYMTDKATAAYARENLDSIVRFLQQFM